MATEKRDLIDRRRLLRDTYFQEGRYPVSHLLRMAIGEQPRVDAVEVVHGRWRWCGQDRYNDAYECSECGKMAMDDSNYCPNCGAKMDGGREVQK